MQTPLYFLVRVSSDAKAEKLMLIEDCSVSATELVRRAIKKELDPELTALYEWTFTKGLQRQWVIGVFEGVIQSEYIRSIAQAKAIEDELQSSLIEIIAATPYHPE